MGNYLEKGKYWERRGELVLGRYGFEKVPTTKRDDIYRHIDNMYVHKKSGVRFTVDVKGPKHLERGDGKICTDVFWVELRRVIRDGDNIPEDEMETPEEYVKEPNNGWVYGDADYIMFIPSDDSDIYMINRDVLRKYTEAKVEENGLKAVYRVRDLIDSDGKPMVHILYTRIGRYDLMTLVGKDELEMLAAKHGAILRHSDFRNGSGELPIPEYLLNYKRKKKTETKKNYYLQITRQGLKDGAGEANGIPAVSCASDEADGLKNDYMSEIEKLSPSDIFKEMWDRDAKASEAERKAEDEWKEYLSPKKHETLPDFIRKIFGKTDKPWDDMTPYEKQRNAFMINRIMAIQFPTSANSLNAVKTDGYSVTEVWRHKVGKLFTRVPDWAYTRTGKSETDKTLSKFKKDTLLHYCKVHECGMRELKEQYKFNPTILDDLKYIETNIINTKDNEQED